MNLYFYDQYISEGLFLSRVGFKRTQKLINTIAEQILNLKIFLAKIKARKLKHKRGRRSEEEMHIIEKISILETKLQKLKDEKNILSTVI